MRKKLPSFNLLDIADQPILERDFIAVTNIIEASISRSKSNILVFDIAVTEFQKENVEIEGLKFSMKLLEKINLVETFQFYDAITIDQIPFRINGNHKPHKYIKIQFEKNTQIQEFFRLKKFLRRKSVPMTDTGTMTLYLTRAGNLMDTINESSSTNIYPMGISENPYKTLLLLMEARGKHVSKNVIQSNINDTHNRSVSKAIGTLRSQIINHFGEKYRDMIDVKEGVGWNITKGFEIVEID